MVNKNLPKLLPGQQIMPTEYRRRELNPKQKRIWKHIADAPNGSTVIVGYGGAAGGGKTRAIVELAVDIALDYPGSRILIGRKDFKDLRTTTMDQFDLHVPRPLIYKRNNVENWREIRDASWPEGVVSRVTFRELKDWMGLGSEEFNAILVDEAGEVPGNSARMLLSRLRWDPRQAYPILAETEQHPDTPWGRRSIDYPDGKPVKYIFVACSNPYPGWFKEWFVDNALLKSPEDISKFTGGIHFVRALPSDNPFLPPGYEEDLRALWPEDWIKRLMEGRWDAFEGQVFPEFSPRIHEWSGGLNNLPPPHTWKRIIGGLDFGGLNPYDHYSAGIVAIELKSNRIIRVAEFESRGPGVVDRQILWMIEQQQKWCKQAPGIPPFIQWCADRSQTVAIQMWTRMGLRVKPSKGGWDSVDVGLSMVKRRLEVDPVGLPGSFYVPEMTQFPERMMSYRMEPPKDDNASVRRRPIDRLTDLCDADRYMHELLENTWGDPPTDEIVRFANPYLQNSNLASKLTTSRQPWKKKEPTDWFEAILEKAREIS